VCCAQAASSSPSRSSRRARADTIIKRREYADAGIPHYWIVDLEPQPSLTACELVDGEYRDAGPVTGTFEAEKPFPVRLDLGALT
jgi:Protein of unknown function (DUF820).